MATLYLIYGFVGVGKTTFAKALEVNKNAIRFSLDEWMIAFYGSNPPTEFFAEYESRTKNMIIKIATKFLENNHNVIFDFGLWSRSERDKYRAFAQNLKVDCVLYSLQASMETIKKRVNTRTEEMPSDAFWIDQNALELFEERYEELTADEEHILIVTG